MKDLCQYGNRPEDEWEIQVDASPDVSISHEGTSILMS